MADDQLTDQAEIERAGSTARDDGAPASPSRPAAADAAAQPLAPSETEVVSGGGEGADEDPEQPRTAEPTGVPATASAEPAPARRAAQAAGQDDKPLPQEGLEKLLEQAGQALAKPEAQPAPPKQAASGPFVGEGTMVEGDVDYLLKQAEQALESISAATIGELPEGMSAFRLPELAGAPASTENTTFDLIRDVELELKIELGRTQMYLEDVLKLRKGSVVPLDKLAGDPVDIYVNGRLIARGEVLVLSDNFCVRVAELIVGTNTSG
jgi:flagellar motor switch protein FliN/FliY